MKITRLHQVTGNMLLQEQLLLNKIEYLQLKRQIEVLATFIPDEILKYKQVNILQKSNCYVGVLLFADVSGFTPLTEKYNKTGKGGIYRLTATLNAYIGALVEVLHFFGGDILKFSGDAFLALWKVKQGESLYEILHRVVVCALIIQKALGYFDTEVNVQLKVKLAIACGNMTFTVIGEGGTKHYIIAGPAIFDVKDAEHVSVSGDVIISPSAWAHMLQDRYEITMAEGGNVKIRKIIYKRSEEKKRIYFEELRTDVLTLIDKHLNHRRDVHAQKNFDYSVTDSKATEMFLKTIPGRAEVKKAPKHWIIDELRPFIIKPVQEQIDESQPVEYLTEMREVTIQFINIVPESYEDNALTEMCNKCYIIICQIVGDALGVVNKVSLFDKDVMILVLFGLRGIRHEMESQHALRSAYSIRQVLGFCKNVLTCSIGITNGLVYCGVVGHPFRREYTVIGTEVNKAARIMVAYPEKVVCDYKTFKHSKLSSFYFKLQPPVALKGIESPGSIFEYNEIFDNVEQLERCHESIIGRESEYNYIFELIYGKTDYRGVCYEGPPKIGKSTVLKQVINPLRATNSYAVVSLELCSKTTSPYFVVRKLYRKIYDERCSLYNIQLETKVNIPRDLFDPNNELYYPKEDIAILKYRILNHFRNLLLCTHTCGNIIFIDNIEFIDLQSWEILDICFLENLFTLISTGNFESLNWDLRYKMSLLNDLVLLTLAPINPNYVSTIACIFLEAAGIPNHLEYMLTQTCEGRPGYIQSSILRLINNGSLQLKLINKSECDKSRFIFPTESLLKIWNQNDILAIVEFSQRYANTGQELTLSAISMDLFDSFSPYQQLVIKTAAVLGEIFTRSLLIVAMKYPAEGNLAKVVQQLFEEEVFDCGSRYINAYDMDVPRVCCQCYFEETDFEKFEYPKYAYCKIIHFKNKSIRDVAYDLLPGNQKKELHLLCTDVIETSRNSCPSCIRQPINAVIHFYHFKTIMTYCKDPKKPFRKCQLEYTDYGDMRKAIRSVIKNEKRNATVVFDNIVRPHYDPNTCNCCEIWCRVYKDLMYHSEQGKHAGKQVYYTMKYGLLLILLKDYMSAIIYLKRANELCLSTANQVITPTLINYRRYIVGQVQVGIAKARLELGQIKGAKNHLAIALRQYNIPSLALQYRGCSEFITRRFLTRSRLIKNVTYANEIFRFDASNCLAFCSRVFAIEGKWKLAKLIALNSLHYLRGANSNVALLSEVYCNAIEIYKFAERNATFEKLQKEVFKEILITFGTLDILQSHSLILLLQTIFESYFYSGQIMSATRLGYKIVDLIIRMDYSYNDPRVFAQMTCLLVLKAQIRDAVSICNLMKSRMDLDPSYSCAYYAICLYIYITTGFQVEEFEAILHFANSVKSGNLKFSHYEDFLFVLIKVHFLRLGKFSYAEEWKVEINWNSQNVRRDIAMMVLRTVLEGRIMTFIKNCKLKSANIEVDRKRLKKLLSLFRHEVEHQYRIYYPDYFCYMAWMERLEDHKNASKKLLMKARKICNQQDNILIKSFTFRLMSSWDGAYSIGYKDRPNVSFSMADEYTFRELAHFQHAYPLI